jgi:hypothetical protein
VTEKDEVEEGITCVGEEVDFKVDINESITVVSVKEGEDKTVDDEGVIPSILDVTRLGGGILAFVITTDAAAAAAADLSLSVCAASAAARANEKAAEGPSPSSCATIVKVGVVVCSTFSVVSVDTEVNEEINTVEGLDIGIVFAEEVEGELGGIDREEVDDVVAVDRRLREID